MLDWLKSLGCLQKQFQQERFLFLKQTYLSLDNRGLRSRAFVPPRDAWSRPRQMKSPSLLCGAYAPGRNGSLQTKTNKSAIWIWTLGFSHQAAACVQVLIPGVKDSTPFNSWRKKIHLTQVKHQLKLHLKLSLTQKKFGLNAWFFFFLNDFCWSSMLNVCLKVKTWFKS